MVLFIRYTKTLGDTAIYARLRNATGQFWDWVSLAWSNSLTADCKMFLLESPYTDDDSVDALYSSSASLPSGGPWVEEVVLVSTGRVIGYNSTEGITDSETLNLKQTLFAYIGSASNIFSKVAGSFVGTISFYGCSFADFAANMADPAGAFICKLNASGVMLDESDVAHAVDSLPLVNGEVLYFKLSSTFNCLTATVVNVYNAVNTGNTRLYVPLGAQYVASIGAYYPTIGSGLLVYENGNLIPLGETAYGKALALIPTINWDRISQPVQLTTTAVIS